MCGVFSSRIYVADSRRVSVLVYFEKRGVTRRMPRDRIDWGGAADTNHMIY